MSESIRILTYTGFGSHYLLVIRGREGSAGAARLSLADNPNIVAAFLINKGDQIAVTQEVYDLLDKQGHIGSKKLEDVSQAVSRQSPQVL